MADLYRRVRRLKRQGLWPPRRVRVRALPVALPVDLVRRFGAVGALERIPQVFRVFDARTGEDLSRRVPLCGCSVRALAESFRRRRPEPLTLYKLNADGRPYYDHAAEDIARERGLFSVVEIHA